MWSRRRALRLSLVTLALSSMIGCGAVQSAAPPVSNAADYPAPPALEAGVALAGAPRTPSAPMAPSPFDLGKPAAPSHAVPAGAQNAKGEATASPKDERPNVLIVYTGDMALTTRGSAAEEIDKIIDAAEGLGGHLAGRTDSVVKVKVPSKSFREALVAVAKLGEVTRQSVTADDVTAQFKDLEVRLQNLRATRKRLEEFLARAPNVQEMLTVERELERVAGELDAIEGRLRYLRDATSFSVLTVTVSRMASPEVAKTVEPPKPPKARAIEMPVEWLDRLGVDTLLTLKK